MMSERELMNRSEKLFVAVSEMRLSVSRRANSASLSAISQISAINSRGKSLRDMAEAEIDEMYEKRTGERVGEKLDGRVGIKVEKGRGKRA